MKKHFDYNGYEIFEGDILTYDWFDCENPIEDMRRKFTSMSNLSDEQISDRIHEHVFEVKVNKKGIMYGKGISKNLYMHNFRFKHTKNLSMHKRL